MLNRPLLDFDSTPDVESRFDLGEQPRRRCRLLFVGLAVLFLGIWSRIAYVQVCLTDDYAAPFFRTTVQYEPIPTHDGRILGSDQEPLAFDEDVYGVEVHYRWLEEPPDPQWLENTARRRLTMAEKRRRERVQAEIDAVLKEREELWRGLGRVLRQSDAELLQRRTGIQRRVERILAGVLARRDATATESSPETSEPEPESVAATTTSFTLSSLPGRWWNGIRQALTQGPSEVSTDPLVIKEQKDYHGVAADVSLDVVTQIQSHPRQFPGTKIVVATRRVYPQGSLAPHIIGYRKPIDSSTVAEYRRKLTAGDPYDLQPGDRIGVAGIERQYNRQLRGVRGVRKLVLSSRGEILRDEIDRLPRPGRDVVLAMNVPLQRAAVELLDNVLSRPADDPVTGKRLPLPTGGVLIALDAQSGAVLASVSGPGYDVNTLVDGDRAAFAGLMSDSRRPLFHRAVSAQLPPGSIFKIVSASAFLDSGRIDPDAMFDCQGFLSTPDAFRCAVFRNFGVGHGPIDLTAALARSCNVYFFSGTRRTGASIIADWGRRFGLGQPTGIDLGGDASGNVPDVPVAPASTGRKKRVVSGVELQLAIGQARLLVTPMQAARMVAAVANGGSLVTPRLVESIGDPVNTDDVTSVFDSTEAPAPTRIEGLTPQTLHRIRTGLAAVVNHPQGTAFKTVRSPHVSIAGKTGTAETGGGRPDHAWFVGYAPAERPRVAFVVVLEHAGSGGHAAGPVARRFVEAMLRLGLLGGKPVGHGHVLQVLGN
jgi:penicillin-binding protein 2